MIFLANLTFSRLLCSFSQVTKLPPLLCFVKASIERSIEPHLPITDSIAFVIKYNLIEDNYNQSNASLSLTLQCFLSASWFTSFPAREMMSGQMQLCTRFVGGSSVWQKLLGIRRMGNSPDVKKKKKKEMQTRLKTARVSSETSKLYCSV